MQDVAPDAEVLVAVLVVGAVVVFELFVAIYRITFAIFPSRPI